MKINVKKRIFDEKKKKNLERENIFIPLHHKRSRGREARLSSAKAPTAVRICS